jgi:hypothetical protein
MFEHNDIILVFDMANFKFLLNKIFLTVNVDSPESDLIFAIFDKVSIV